MPARELVVGGDSAIGGALAGHFSDAGWQVQATTRRPDQVDEGRPYLDLAAPTALPPADVVLMCAAVARIGDCENNPASSHAINVDGTLAVARQMAGQGAHVLLLSTDNVFDGRKAKRDRNAGPCPTCAYGRQKAEAEAGILALGDRGAVLRLSKVLTPGNELLADWAEALAAGQTIAPFHDLYLAPITVDLVAKLAIRIAGERAGERAGGIFGGIFQCAGAEDRNYVDLARILLAEHGGDEDLIQPISCRDTNMPAAAGPRHTFLEMSVEQNLWGIAAPEFGATARAVILAGNASPA